MADADITLDDLNVTAEAPKAPALMEASEPVDGKLWLRKISFAVYDSSGQQEPGAGIELSMLRVNFRVKKATAQSPNILDAKIYNLSPQTMAKIVEFRRVQLSAGYRTTGYGKIFDGKVVQYRRGKDTAVDSYLQIIAGDGEDSLNSAVMIKTFPAGSTDEQVVKDALAEWKKIQPELKEGHLDPAMAKQKSLRAHTMAAMVDKTLRDIANKYNLDFYIDNGTANFVSRKKALPGEAIVLSPRTGLVGMPQITPQGVQVTALLNSRLRLGGLIKLKSENLTGLPFEPGSSLKTGADGNVIFESNLPQQQQFPGALWNQELTAAYTSPIGIYKILLLDYSGDTRGNEWYAQMVCLAMAADGKTVLSVGDDALIRASGEAVAGLAT